MDFDKIYTFSAIFKYCITAENIEKVFFYFSFTCCIKIIFSLENSRGKEYINSYSFEMCSGFLIRFIYSELSCKKRCTENAEKYNCCSRRR